MFNTVIADAFCTHWTSSDIFSVNWSIADVSLKLVPVPKHYGVSSLVSITLLDLPSTFDKLSYFITDPLQCFVSPDPQFFSAKIHISDKWFQMPFNNQWAVVQRML